MIKLLKQYGFIVFTILLMAFLIIGKPFDSTIPRTDLPDEERLEGIILNTFDLPTPESQTPEQKLEVIVTKGSITDQTITVTHDATQTGPKKFKEKDKIIIIKSQDQYYVADYVRSPVLIWLFLIFVAVLLLSAGWQGLSSLLGMLASFVIIFKFILPQLLSGAPPIQTVILGSLIIIPLTFYLSHGFKRKTHIAMLGTLIALLISVILITIFSNLSHLSGFASEDYIHLSDAVKANLDFKGLLLAGMIISILGVLDDVTISQASIVEELKKANPRMRLHKLYISAMKVGKDHIASMVNTLILVYTGASLTLLLVFLDYSESFTNVINYEFLASEIIQTLVGSIGLILAVPITTLLAGYLHEKSH